MLDEKKALLVDVDKIIELQNKFALAIFVSIFLLSRKKIKCVSSGAIYTTSY